MPYVLEVQKYVNSLSEHVGYMNKVFRTKQEACEYYDKHNPHMRKLNTHKSLRSDWDPTTHLLYVVRSYYSEILDIQPFQ
jgi:hypothetical protein